MIIFKSEKEIGEMRRGGKILAAVLKEIAKNVKPGTTTGQLEELANSLIKKQGGRPSFKGYRSQMEGRPFPTALCASINNEVVHAPSLPSRRLHDGDIIGIDLGMEYPFGEGKKGYYTDMAVTLPVGKVSKEGKKLISVTKKALDLAIKRAKPGNTLGDIGGEIQRFVESQGFGVVRDLVGHGVGMAVHEDPQVPNYLADKVKDIILKPGMTLAIEPMVNAGSYAVTGAPDGFTVKTEDGALSAHFEHTIAITEKGCEILTR